MSLQTHSFENLNKLYNQSIKHLQIIYSNINETFVTKQFKESIGESWFFRKFPHKTDNKSDYPSLKQFNYLFDDEIYDIDQNNCNTGFCIEQLEKYSSVVKRGQ